MGTDPSVVVTVRLPGEVAAAIVGDGEKLTDAVKRIVMESQRSVLGYAPDSPMTPLPPKISANRGGVKPVMATEREVVTVDAEISRRLGHEVGCDCWRCDWWRDYQIA